jgi:hypothetical protein
MKTLPLMITGLLVLLCAVAASPVSAQDTGEFPVLDKQVEIRQAHLAYLAELHTTRMDGAIGYLEDIGADTAGLEEIAAQFAAQAAEIQDLDTHIGLNNAVRQCQETAAHFREECRIQLQTAGGDAAALRAAVEEAVANNGEIEALKNRYWEIRTDHELAIFDLRVSHASEILERLAAHGYDTTEAGATLAVIEDLRVPLKEALLAQDIEEVREIQQEIRTLSEELRDIVRNLSVEVPNRAKIQLAIHLADRAIERSGMIIDDLARLGFDVATLERWTDAAAEDLADAESAFEAGDMEGARDALEEVRDDFAALRDAYHDLVNGEDLSRGTEATVEGLVTQLDTAIDTLDDLE